MLANVVSLSLLPSRSQDADGLTLPEKSAELLEAERQLAEVTFDLEATRADLSTLNSNFNVLGIKRGNGEPFPFPGDGRNAALAELHFRCADLEASRGRASRNLDEARRNFSDQTFAQLRPALDGMCDRAIERLAEVEAMLDMMHYVTIEARQAGISLQHGPLGRAQYLARQLHSMRAALAPTPTMGVRR